LPVTPLADPPSDHFFLIRGQKKLDAPADSPNRGILYFPSRNAGGPSHRIGSVSRGPRLYANPPYMQQLELLIPFFGKGWCFARPIRWFGVAPGTARKREGPCVRKKSKRSPMGQAEKDSIYPPRTSPLAEKRGFFPPFSGGLELPHADSVGDPGPGPAPRKSGSPDSPGGAGPNANVS